MTALATTARVIHLLILSVWFGASLMFMTLGRTMVDVLGSRHDAGSVVTVLLERIDLFGLVTGPVLLATLFVGWAPLNVRLRFRAVGALAMTGAVLVSGRVVTPKIVTLIQAMGRRIDEMDPAGEFMVQYSQLHTMSVWLMLLHVALAFLMIVGAVRTSQPKRSFGIEL